MRSIVSRLLVVAVVAIGLFVVAPAAEAHPQTCTGQGVMTTPALFYPPGSSTGPFTLSFNAPCTPPGGVFGSGTITGSCGSATGSGSLNGHSFTFTWLGEHMTLSGDVHGVLVVHPDITTTPSQSCLSGATQLLLTGTITTGPLPVDPFQTIDPIVQTVEDFIDNPPVGGPPGPSLDCTTGTIVNNTNPDLKVRVQDVGTQTWVCVRALTYGGKLVIERGSGGGPPIPVLPSTDANAAACPSPTSGNIGDPGDPEYTEYLVGTQVTTSEAWLCARVNSTAVRVVVPVPAPGIPPLPTVTFQADPGTPDPI